MNQKEPKYIRGKYTQGQKESTKKYQAKAYDSILVRFKKGEKTLLQEFATLHGYSLNNFIVTAVFSYLEELKKQTDESKSNT